MAVAMVPSRMLTVSNRAPFSSRRQQSARPCMHVVRAADNEEAPASQVGGHLCIRTSFDTSLARGVRLEPDETLECHRCGALLCKDVNCVVAPLCTSHPLSCKHQQLAAAMLPVYLACHGIVLPAQTFGHSLSGCRAWRRMTACPSPLPVWQAPPRHPRSLSSWLSLALPPVSRSGAYCCS